MGLLVVGIGDCQVSGDVADELVTYALGSCIAIAVHDPASKVGGLLHILLPDSSLDPIKAKANPFMFADSGIPILFRRAYALGARKERLNTQIIGGAQMNSASAAWEIGKKNVSAVRGILQRAGVPFQSDVIGGDKARTVRLNVNTGAVSITEMKGSSAKAIWDRLPGSKYE